MKIENSKLKILICTGVFAPEIGGPASYARLLSGRLPAGSVTVLTYSKNFSYAGDKELPFPVVRVWSGMPKIIRHVAYLFHTCRLAGKNDLVYALNAISAGWPAWLAARWYKKKFLVKIVGDAAWERAMIKGKTHYLLNDFQKFPRKGFIGLLHRIQVKVCKYADVVIVPSEYLAIIVRGWGIAPEKVKVIYNSVEVPAVISKEEAKKIIGVPGNIILSAGRLVSWKGFRMLIKIMPQLLQINQFFRLIIIGDGPERKNLQSMVKNLGLERKIFVVGKKTHAEMAAYLAAADMFVLNTGYEGFSHQILEAMAAGVPVVTTAVGGNREVIRQGENGFMVKYNDEFNLIEAVKTLWQLPELREKFIQEGRKTAEQFTVDKMLKETIRVISNA